MGLIRTHAFATCWVSVCVCVCVCVCVLFKPVAGYTVCILFLGDENSAEFYF